MPLIFSRRAGAQNPATLWIEDYAPAAYVNQLTPNTRALGFKTFVDESNTLPDIANEENYVTEFVEKGGADQKKWYRDVHTAARRSEAIQRAQDEADQQAQQAQIQEVQQAQNEAVEYLESKAFQKYILLQLARIHLTMASAPNMNIPIVRPSLLVNGLASVSEDKSASSATTPSSASTATSPNRDAARLNMLRRMRPPPFQYAWTFYHDKHSDSTHYEGRLTVMQENIITVKTFWEVFNGFPLSGLKMKDSVHLFKRGVKPVWEDPRNLKGGSWTFRVPKDKSDKFWQEIALMVVGEQFADVIQPKDDLCGISLSTRFNSNLITIWNRDGTNEKTITGIQEVILSTLPPELKPKEGAFYYKKHSEHNGFGDVIAKAQEAKKKAQEQQHQQSSAPSSPDSNSPTSGKIKEAIVHEDEGDIALIKEAEAEEEEEEAQAGMAA